jgi:DNA-binding CsgD family transcriptional regulator
MPETGRDAEPGQAGAGADALLGLVHGVVRSLASTTTLTEVLRVVVARGAHELEPIAAAIACEREHALVEVARWGSPSLAIGAGRAVSADTLEPWTDAVELCEPVWVASADERRLRYPDARYGDDVASLAALPLVANGAAYGALVIGFASATSFDERQRALLVLLGDLCSLLLGRPDPADGSGSALRPRVELTRAGARGGGTPGWLGAPERVNGNGNGSGHAPALSAQPRLTAREQQIALALTEGRRSSAVARDLGISIYTVRKHISAILRKYDVTSQSELIARIYRESRA